MISSFSYSPTIQMAGPVSVGRMAVLLLYHQLKIRLATAQKSGDNDRANLLQELMDELNVCPPCDGTGFESRVSGKVKQCCHRCNGPGYKTLTPYRRTA